MFHAENRTVNRSAGNGEQSVQPLLRSRVRAVLVGMCLALAAITAAPALAGAAVTISPLAGTPDASPATQISILGTAATNIASVTVTGSESGPHEGHLASYSAAPGQASCRMRRSSKVRKSPSPSS